MKKAKLTKMAVLFLIVSFVISCIVACQTPESKLIKRFEETMTNDIGNVKFTAALQQPVISSGYNLEITVKGKQIYLNNVLYDRIYQVDDLDLNLADVINYESVAAIWNPLFDEMKKQGEFYIIATDSEKNFGKDIAVSELAGKFYFLRFDDSGYVSHIHSVDILNLIKE